MEGLCHGNLTEEEAISISNIFKTNFQVQPLPIELRHAERVICLPSGANLVRDVNVKNKLEKNSVVEVNFIELVLADFLLMLIPYISNQYLNYL